VPAIGIEEVGEVLGGDGVAEGFHAVRVKGVMFWAVSKAARTAWVVFMVGKWF
jgi:hypothetical protein